MSSPELPMSQASLFEDMLKSAEEEESCNIKTQKNQEILERLAELEKFLCNTLFSIKYFRSDTSNLDAEFINLVEEYQNLVIRKEQSEQEKENNREIHVLSLSKYHLTEEKKDDEDNELIVDDQPHLLQNVCKICRSELVDPVTQRMGKNKDECPHTFGKNCILRLMKGKNIIDCPVAGCNKKIYKKKLVRDYEFLQYNIYNKLNSKYILSKEIIERTDADNTNNNLYSTNTSPLKGAKSAPVDLTDYDVEDEYEDRTNMLMLIKKEKDL